METALQKDQEDDRYCPDEFLQIDGYQMFRKDNPAEIKGGIITYVKNHILVSKNKTIDNLASEFKESLWLELDISGDKVMFGTVYRKGKSTPVNNKLLLEVISKVTRSYKKIVIWVILLNLAQTRS